MGEIILGMVGVLLMIVSFFAGIFVGSAGSKKKLKDWIEENGCYECAEKWKYRNPLTNESN